MGIHNSSYLSIVWRVANHNMKAFVTICALMAGSASAESQHMVSFSQPLAIPANPLSPYSVYSPPLHPVSYANLQVPLKVPQVPLRGATELQSTSGNRGTSTSGAHDLQVGPPSQHPAR